MAHVAAAAMSVRTWSISFSTSDDGTRKSGCPGLPVRFGALTAQPSPPGRPPDCRRGRGELDGSRCRCHRDERQDLVDVVLDEGGWDSQEADAQGFQFRLARNICGAVLGKQVDPAIHFHRETTLVTVKVQDEPPNCVLSTELQPIEPAVAEPVPKQLLSRSLGPPKRSGCRNVVHKAPGPISSLPSPESRLPSPARSFPGGSGEGVGGEGKRLR